MIKSFAARTLGVFAVLVLASCLGESTGPGDLRYARLNFAPVFDSRGLRAVDVNRARVVITRAGGQPVLRDTTVDFPASEDTLQLDLDVPVQGAQEDLEMTLQLLDDPGGVIVFQAGPTTFTAVAGTTTPPIEPVLLYTGTGANAVGVRFVASPDSVKFGDTVLFTAEAFDASSVTIPNTPIVWSSSDPARASVTNDTIGRFVGGIVRGPVTVTAELLRTSETTAPPNTTQPLVVVAKPNQIAVQSGGGQSGPGGQPLAQPVTVRVRAADNLGVAGEVVNFAVVTGGGSVNPLIDTTDLNGDASTTWTLGGPAGGQSISATVAGVTGVTVNVAATSVVGAATQLAFTSVPTGVVSGVVIAPAIQVTARDAGGSTATGFTGNVTLALANNPTGATLSGTLTIAAVAGVATFSNVSIDNIGAGYTFSATSAPLTPATSVAVGVTAPAGVNAWINPAGGNWNTPANWSLGTVPAASDTVHIKLSGIYTVNLDVNATVPRLEVGGPTGNQILQIAANTLTMAGSGTFAPTGTLTLDGGTLRGPGTLAIGGAFTWLSGSVGGDGGTTTVSPLGFLTIGGAATRTLVSHAIEVAGTGTWSGTGQVNSGSAGTIRVLTGGTLDLQGDLLWAFNQGGTTSRLDIQGGTVNRTTGSGVFAIPAITNNGVLNVQSGELHMSNGGTINGTFNVAAGTVLQFDNGAFQLNASAQVTGAGTLDMSGATTAVDGTWSVTGSTQVRGGNHNFNTGGAKSTANLNVSSGTLGGSGLLTVTGAMNWTGGALGAGTGVTRVASGASLAISGAATRTFVGGYALEVAGSGIWTGTHQVNAGSGAVLRVLAGGTLDVQGDPTVAFNQGGAANRTEVFGTLSRTTSTSFATFGGEFDNDGSTTVSSGTLRLTGGSGAGSSDGTWTSFGTAFLDFNGGVHALGSPGGVSGAGAVMVSGGTVNAAGTWSLSGSTLINGGALNYGAAGGSTFNLDVSSGTLGGGSGGLFNVTNSFSWTGGSLAGGGGITRVGTGATLAIAGTATRTMTNYVLELAGPGTWSGAHQINTGSAAVLRVLPTGSLDVQGTPVFAFNQGGAVSVVDNQGTLIKSGTGTLQLGGTFNTSGTVTVSQGTLQAINGGSLGNAITIVSPATVNLAGGTFNAAGNTLNATGTGRVVMTGGQLNVAVATDTADFTTLELNGGTLVQTGVVRVASLLDWTGGTAITGTGKVLIPVGSSMSITGTVGRAFTGGIIENNALAAWSSNLQINTGIGAILRNMAGATFTMTGDGVLAFNQGGATSVFDNQGVFSKQTSTNAVTWSVQFDQAAAATTTINTGTLIMSGGGAHRGTFNVAAGAFLDYAGGTFTFNTHQQNGTGTARWQGATLNTASATDSAKFVNLQLNTGILAHSGVVRVNTLFDWAGGASISGTGKVLIPLGGTFTGTGVAGRQFTSGVIENNGTATFGATFQINAGLGAVIRNMPGATFTLSGDATYLNNQGAPQPVFDNQGSFARTTSTNTVIWSAFYQDTVGSTAMQSGVFQLTGGGRFGGTGKTISGGVTNSIQLNGGTVSMRPGTAFTGVGVLAVANGNLTADAASLGNPVNIQNLTIGNLGAFTHDGLVQVNGALTWAGGTIGALAGPGGGTTRVMATGTLAITQAFGHSLIGNHILDVLGPTTHSAAGNVNAGLGVTVNNANTWTWSGDGSVFSNQGGTALTFNNLAAGILRRTTSANTVVLDGFMNKLGVFDIQTGGLQLNRGSVTNFGGAVTGAGFLDLAAGTFTTTANLTVAGGLDVSGGSLVWAGANRLVSVGGTFRTIGTGVISMAAATDSLDVTGTAQFSGGASTLSNGAVRLGGNFVQTGTNSFAPTGTQRSRMTGTVAQSISFADPVNSFFRTLFINKATGAGQVVNLLNTTQVMDSLRLDNGTEITGGRLGVNGILRVFVSTSTPLVHPAAVVVVPANLQIGAGAGLRFFPDTTVFASSGNVPFGAQIRYTHVAVNAPAGTVTWPAGGAASDTLHGDMIISNGNLSVQANAIFQQLKTVSTGTFSMLTGGVTVTVRDTALFGGGSTTGGMTTGTLSVGGNFVQQGGSPSAFDPSTAHVTTLVNTVNSTVFFANPTTSAFDALSVNKSTGARFTVNFQTNARVKRDMSVNNSSDVTGPTARITIGNSIQIPQVTTSGTLQNVLAVEIGTLPTIGAGAPIFAPDTTVINGGVITTLPIQAQIQYRSVRINSSGTVTIGSVNMTGDLDIGAGTASMPTGTISVGGKLRTRGTGILAMPIGAGGATLTVSDSAIFGGGLSAPQTGTLRLLGHFNATGGSYQPQAGHLTTFAGNVAGGQRVFFSSPGIAGGNSWFGNLFIGRAVAGSSAPTGITLGSNVFAIGTLQDTSTNGAANDSILGPGVVTAVGLQTGTQFVMNNAQLVVNGSTTFITNGLTFRNMNPTSVFLTLNRNGIGTNTVSGVHFQTTPTGAGRYFAVNQTGAGLWTVNFQAPVTPATGAAIIGLYTRTGSTLPNITWNGTPNP